MRQKRHDPNMISESSKVLSMVNTRSICSGLILALAALSGCAQPRPPAGSAEGLRRLDMLSGTWKSTSTACMEDAHQPIECSATARLRWDLDGRFLVEQTDYDLGTLGRSTVTGYWTWDAAAGVYRTWHFDSDGGYATGTATFDVDSQTWYLASQTINSRTGARSAGSGKMRFTSDREKDFSWSSQPREGGDDAYRGGGHQSASRQIGNQKTYFPLKS